MDQAPFEPPKRGRGGDTHTPQARVDIARREEQIVALRLRHIPFAAIARTVGVNKSNAIRAFTKALRRTTDQQGMPSRSLCFAPMSAGRFVRPARNPSLRSSKLSRCGF